jgi:hypothetical protein
MRLEEIEEILQAMHFKGVPGHLVHQSNHILIHSGPDGEIFILGRQENPEILRSCDLRQGDVILAVFPV